MIDAVVAIAGLEMQRGVGDSRFRMFIDRLEIEGGQPVLLVGENGSGKSSLLDVIGLVLRPKRMTQFVYHPRAGGDVDVAALFQREDDAALTNLRCSEIGYMPQTGGLVPFLSVRDNIALPSILCGRRDPGFIDQLCGALEITPMHLALRPQDLSIGQRQRVCLARAFAHRPRLLLADEPTASLDVVSAAVVSEMLLEAAPKYGITPVIATHDPRLVDKADLRRITLHAKAVGPSEVECHIAAAA
ncbi:ABC transporter ATP-binding protein [Dongia sedimenti]|uniref:ABC transporter ATP-binding protein n=1 Tax=Dongia sedimenti TaxID=3064282 RepID=A0ABU0YMI5_9PROT|nr:ABC transporter ATP-binding protein [Rhodospirillaceae bacterium R-7]